MTNLMRALAILFGIKEEVKPTQESIILAELEREWRQHKLQQKIINDISTFGR